MNDIVEHISNILYGIGTLIAFAGIALVVVWFIEAPDTTSLIIRNVIALIFAIFLLWSFGKAVKEAM